MPAFLPPTPLQPAASRLPRSSLTPSTCLSVPPTPASLRMSTPVWDGVKRLIRVSALSATMLFTPHAAPVRRAAFVPPAHAATQTQSSDVEAAAMTLGAVTVGGLLMRAIVSARRDEKAEQAALKEECERLAREEEERAMRKRRRELESLGDDDGLLSELKERVKSLDQEQETESDQDMRQFPIPDRGMGSAVLERPEEDGEAGGVDADSEGEAEGQPDSLANTEQAEMLKRMWNLSPPDKNESSS